ncbi:MAG: NifU family protein [Planctomycetota bacterium]
MSGWLARVLGKPETPRPPPYGDAAELAAVEAVIATQRAYFRADGGDVELAGIREGWVEVRLFGGCSHCPSQDQSLAHLLAPRLRAALPWVKGVRSVS